jgi:hypothetical protein
MATQQRRGSGFDTSAVPLVDGGTENGTAKGHEKSLWSEHDLIAGNR